MNMKTVLQRNSTADQYQTDIFSHAFSALWEGVLESEL